MSEFYKTYVKLCAEAKKSLTKAAVEAGLSNAAPSGWKAGKEISDISLQKLANYFTEQLHRSITVSDLLDSKSSSGEIVNNLANSVNIAMYDGSSYGEVPDDIKNLAAAFALAKKEQDIKDPALRKIVDICKKNPEYVQPLAIMLDQLIKTSERKSGAKE